MNPTFDIYSGDTGDLRTNGDYWVFRWNNPNCHILFSATRQGKAATCHFTSDKAGLRKLKQAINDWCEFCFWLFDWCEMIIGIIEKISILKLAKSCGFEHIISFGKKHICIRRKSWVV